LQSSPPTLLAALAEALKINAVAATALTPTANRSNIDINPRVDIRHLQDWLEET
jgi:hypothetical protein